MDGERKSAVKSSKTIDLHYSCRMPERPGDEIAKCDMCCMYVWYTATAWIYSVKCLVISCWLLTANMYSVCTWICYMYCYELLLRLCTWVSCCCVMHLTVITLTRLSYNVGIHVCPCDKAHSKFYFCLSELLLGVVAPRWGCLVQAYTCMLYVVVVVHVQYYPVSDCTQSFIQYKKVENVIG